MDKKIIENLFTLAKSEIENGYSKNAYRLLKPFIERECSEALFLYSMFSFTKEESLEEFDKRSIDLLQKASALEHPAAMYALAGYYDTGDIVPINRELAARLIQNAAQLGYNKAMLEHGLNLYYGSYIEKDINLALGYLSQAAKEGNEDAKQVLNDLNFDRV